MFGLTPYVHHGVSNYNPFADLDAFEKEFFGGHGLSSFKTDIRDEGDHYTLEADLPGFKKEDIKISAENGCLTIEAERNGEETEEKKKGYVRRERSYGKFSRSFDITGISEEGIKAAFADGVLTLTLPKAGEKAEKSRLITVE